MEHIIPPDLRKLDLSRARYFLAVSRLGSFTAAAKHCKVSQPSVTTSLQELEAVLGGRLFERSASPKSRAIPTPLAEAVTPFLEQMIVNAENAFYEAAKWRRK